jgi:ABC-2 type transport system permease protein
MREILAMVGKDLRVLARDPMGFFFTFIFPLVFAVFFGTMFSGSGRETRGLQIALVDEDRSAESKALAAQLDTVPELSLQAMDRAQAREAVRLGKRVAYVVIPAGFGESRRRMFTGKGPELEIGLDPSRKAEGGMIQGVLARYLSEQMQTLFARPEKMQTQVRQDLAVIDTSREVPAAQRAPLHRFLGELDRFLSERQADTTTADSGRAGTGWSPVNFKTTEVARLRNGPRNAYEVSFPQGVLWAILNGAFGFAMGLVNERTRGTLVRLRMAPVSRGKILAAKAGAALLSILIVATIVLGLGAIFFGVRPGSVPLLALAVISAAAALVGIMMVISVSGTSPRGVSGLGWAVMMAMSMTGGGMIPLFAMPPWMQTASMVSPVRWVVIALEGAIWRGFSPAQMALPCGILLGLAVVTFAFGTRMMKWTQAA